MPKKSVKKAEKSMTDATKFPIESCREKLARRFGIDAVALSGPCEGQPLAESICDQLKNRWNSMDKRFASDTSKVVRLAEKLGESWAKKEDDTQECIKDLEVLNYPKEAASGIANYLKAYHLDKSAMGEMEMMMSEIMGKDEEDDDLDNLSMDKDFGDMGDDDDDMDIGMDDDMDMPGLDDDLGGELEPGELEPGNGDTVSIEIPIEVAEELVSAIEGYEHDITDVDDDDAFEIIELDDDMGMGGMGDSDDEIVPGEPEDKPEGLGDDQFVEGKDGEEHETACDACGGSGRAEKEEGMTANIGRPDGAGQPEDDAPMAPPGMKGTPHQFSSNKETITKEAAMALKGGRLRRIGQSTLKIGPEMSINNTDQQAGGHDLGNASEKATEDPKALEDGNIKTDAGGHMAGGDKVQDGSTMGHESKFDAHELTKEEVSGGSSSLQGDDESFPEGSPSVPAGSSPIGNEELDGGDVSTKGTVIATITPNGIRLDASDKEKPVLAKISITSNDDTAGIAEAIGSLEYKGDIKAFALAAIRIVKAKKDKKDGITYTDTSKLEGDNFTNDAEKAPQDGSAKSSSGAGKDGGDMPTTNTSELEGTKFTNDAEKSAETDDEAKNRSAGSRKSTKTAADSDKDKVVNHHSSSVSVEDPKALEDGNIKTDAGGHMAGGDKVQDGSTIGNEGKFDAHEVAASEVSGGNSSLMGDDESLPTEGPEVPSSGENIQNEEFTGDNVSSKGTVIAEEGQSQKREASDLARAKNDAKVREARIKSASVLVADMLSHGEITTAEYAETLERFSSFEVPAIQALALSIKKTREKVIARTAKVNNQQAKTAGLGIPVIYDPVKEEKPLTQRLSEMFSSNKLYDPEMWDENGRRRIS